jgi:hypothetical protein
VTTLLRSSLPRRYLTQAAAPHAPPRSVFTDSRQVGQRH